MLRREFNQLLPAFAISPAGAGANADRTAADAAARLLSRIRWPGLKFQSHPNAVGVRYNKLAINALGVLSAVCFVLAIGTFVRLLTL